MSRARSNASGLPQDFNKPTLTFASFQRQLGTLGGARVPFVGTNRRWDYEFASWKTRFAFKLSEWIEMETNNYEPSTDATGESQDDCRLLLWIIMGEQLKEVVLIMHGEIKKRERNESGARPWSIAQLFLYFSGVRLVFLPFQGRQRSL